MNESNSQVEPDPAYRPWTPDEPPPHRPAQHCVNTCNNPYECQNDWAIYQTHLARQPDRPA